MNVPPNYEWWTFTDSRGVSYDILTTGTGPGVLVLHELPGLSEECLTLGRDLAEAGMSAHLPVFYQRGWHQTPLGALRLFCLRREFFVWVMGQTSPIATWIREAAAEVEQRCRHPGVGVVGMCMTGGLALASLTQERVAAAVSSQPTLPLPLCKRARADLGLSPSDVQKIVRRRPPILALRFQDDRMCPTERLESIKATFPAAAIRCVPGKGHSVLTRHLRRTDHDHPAMQALREVVQFLSEHLGVRTGPPPRP